MSTDKASHTPAPWVLDDCEGEDHYRYIFHGEGDYLETIARIDLAKHQPKRRELEANARLMAASPELLDVCKELQRLMPVIESSVRWGDLKNHPQVEALLLANVAAIAKAEHLWWQANQNTKPRRKASASPFRILRTIRKTTTPPRHLKCWSTTGSNRSGSNEAARN